MLQVAQAPQPLTSAEIALAFNHQNSRKAWTARANSRPESGRDMVHFSTSTGIVSLSFNASDGRWQVQFNKFHSTWGDYVKAIARALHVVLNTLKSAGLPFDAPATAAGVEIIVTASDDSTTYVRWQGAPVYSHVTYGKLQSGTIGAATSNDPIAVQP